MIQSCTGICNSGVLLVEFKQAIYKRTRDEFQKKRNVVCQQSSRVVTKTLSYLLQTTDFKRYSSKLSTSRVTHFPQPSLLHFHETLTGIPPRFSTASSSRPHCCCPRLPKTVPEINPLSLGKEKKNPLEARQVSWEVTPARQYSRSDVGGVVGKRVAMEGHLPQL